MYTITRHYYRLIGIKFLALNRITCGFAATPTVLLPGLLCGVNFNVIFFVGRTSRGEFSAVLMLLLLLLLLLVVSKRSPPRYAATVSVDTNKVGTTVMGAGGLAHLSIRALAVRLAAVSTLCREVATGGAASTLILGTIRSIVPSFFFSIFFSSSFSSLFSSVFLSIFSPVRLPSPNLFPFAVILALRGCVLEAILMMTLEKSRRRAC